VKVRGEAEKVGGRAIERFIYYLIVIFNMGNDCIANLKVRKFTSQSGSEVDLFKNLNIENYERWSLFEEAAYSFLKKYIGDISGIEVLSVGAKCLNMENMLADEGVNVTAIGPEIGKCTYTVTHPDLEIEKCLHRESKYFNGNVTRTWDIVIGAGLLTSPESRNDYMVVPELESVVRKGGFLLFTDCEPLGDYLKNLKNYVILRRENWCDENGRRAGFRKTPLIEVGELTKESLGGIYLRELPFPYLNECLIFKRA
jgi:hypothetical protein